MGNSGFRLQGGGRDKAVQPFMRAGINVEIPSLSVSDMRRLKATDHVGTYTLFQECYHRPTFCEMHVAGPKSDYNHCLLTMDRAMRGGLDDVGIGTLFGLSDYRYEVCVGGVHYITPL